MKMVKQIVMMAFAALMAQCVWADMAAWTGTLSESADAPTKVFTSVVSTIAELKSGVEDGTLFLGGKMGGGSITGSRAFSAVVLDTSSTTEDALVYQFQLNDVNHSSDKHLKVAWVKFTNGEDGIYAVETCKGYFNNEGPNYVGTYHSTSDTGWGSMAGNNYQVVELHVSNTAVATAVPSWVTTGEIKKFATLADAMSAADEATIIEGATVPDNQIEITRANNAFIYNGSVSVSMATKFTSGMGGSNKKNVTKKGSGTVTLTASNTESTSCAMVIAEGTAVANAANAFGTGMLTVQDGAVATIAAVNSNQTGTAYDVTLNGGTLKSAGVGDAHGKLVKSLTLGADSSFVCTSTSGDKLIGIGANGVATTLDLNTHKLTLTGVGTGRYQRVYLDKTTISSAGTIEVTKGHLFLHCGSITAPADTKIIIDANASIACDNQTLSVPELEYNGTVSVDSSDACMVTVTSKFSGTGSIPKLTLGDGAEVSGSATVTTEATAEGTVMLKDGATLTVPTAFEENTVTTDATDKHVVMTDVTGGVMYSLAVNEYTITLTPVDNTTMVVTVNDETVVPENSTITAAHGSTIVVTYSAAEGYIMADKTATITATESTTIAAPEGTTPVQAVAKIDTTLYPSLVAAVGDAENGAIVELLDGFSLDEEISVSGKAVQIRTSDYKTAVTPSVGLRVNYMDKNKIDAQTIIYFRKSVSGQIVEIDRLIVGDFEPSIDALTTINAKESVRYVIGLHKDIKLTKDIVIPSGANRTSSANMNVKASIVFDLNGYSITQTAGSGWSNYTLFDATCEWTLPLLEEQTFTLKNSQKESGQINVPLHAVHTEGKVHVIIEDVKIVYGVGCSARDKQQDDDTGGQAVVVFDAYQNSTVTLKGSTSITPDPDTILTGKYPWVLLPYGQATINVESGFYDGLFYGNGAGFGSLNITGGIFTSNYADFFKPEGYETVLGNDGYYYMRVKHDEDARPKIVVTEESIAPVQPAAADGWVEVITPENEVLTGADAVLTVPATEASGIVYTVVTKTAENKVLEVANVGIINVKEEASVKTTIAVAVPFTGATVENLLNTALLSEGDTVMAYVDDSYKVWELAADKTWQARAVTREGGTDMSPEASTTPLKRGQAVWVTTSGKIVTIGDMSASGDTPVLEDGHNLLGNTALVEATPVAAETEQIQLIGEENVSRYNKTATGWESKIQTRTQLSNGKWVVTETTGTAEPKVKPGRGFWRIKPASK